MCHTNPPRAVIPIKRKINRITELVRKLIRKHHAGEVLNKKNLHTSSGLNNPEILQMSGRFWKKRSPNGPSHRKRKDSRSYCYNPEKPREETEKSKEHDHHGKITVGYITQNELQSCSLYGRNLKPNHRLSFQMPNPIHE